MSGPKNVSLKRRATEEPPDVLVLQSRAQTDQPVRYVRQRMETEEVDTTKRARFADPLAKDRRERAERYFHLHAPLSGVAGKKRAAQDELPTFVEKAVTGTNDVVAPEPQTSPEGSPAPSARPLKRPGTRAVNRATSTAQGPQADADRKQIETLANSMHQAALEEVRQEEKREAAARTARAAFSKVDSPPVAKRIAPPRLSGLQSREIHRQRTAAIASKKDTVMQDDGDYVYDTYILAPSDSSGTAQVDTESLLENVGYLVITAEDQSLWEAYLEAPPSDNDENSDEEDENAEDYYGADYPEDEMASDDEFDRGAYRYRRHAGSDDEEYDEYTGAYSDGGESDSVTNPFKTRRTPQQFVKDVESADDSD